MIGIRLRTRERAVTHGRSTTIGVRSGSAVANFGIGCCGSSQFAATQIPSRPSGSGPAANSHDVPAVISPRCSAQHSVPSGCLTRFQSRT